LHAYYKVGLPVAADLENALADTAKAVRVTLEICHQKNADPQQFEITRALARDWVVANASNSLA